MCSYHRGEIGHSVSNDIKKGEKTAERTAKHTGRDDRATSEQVISAHNLFLSEYRMYIYIFM